MARKRRGVSWPLDLSTFRWKRPPPSEGQKGGEAPPASPPTLLSYRGAPITRSIAGCLRFFTFTQCSDMHRLVDVGLLQSETIELSRARLVAKVLPR